MGQDEPNPALWLASRAGKMVPSFQLETNDFHPPFCKIAASARLVIWNTFLKREIAELDCFWHCFEKIARKTQGLAPTSNEYLYHP